MKIRILIPLLSIITLLSACDSETDTREKAVNPIIWADVPDISMVRVGDYYYSASTTMHMNPGLPIMKSDDLVNWEIVSYAYETLVDNDDMNLKDGNHAYGRGSWAPSLRYHDGMFYASTFSSTSDKTHIYTSEDPENGEWQETSFSPSLHDHSLFFDDDSVYMIYGVGTITLVELESDLSGVKEETERVLVEDASAPAGDDILLPAEGTQLFKIDDTYYMFNITWVEDGMRKVIIHRADDLYGPYEGRLALRDRGIAQGGIVDTPEGDWYAYMFRDNESVGRIPYLMPVQWEDDWPVLGVDSEVPDTLDLPASTGLAPGIIASDDFKRQEGDPDLPLVWQWNHNPVNELWSVRERDGYLRLTTGETVTELQEARNTLTQRTFGPVSAASTMIEVDNMKEGDFAGISALQLKYGQVGVTYENGNRYVIMISNQTTTPEEIERVPLEQPDVYLRVEVDYRDEADEARFFYSLDGDDWQQIGDELEMEYTLMEHFMGYRFGLFNYATENTGGFVDFGFYEVSDSISW